VFAWLLAISSGALAQDKPPSPKDEDEVKKAGPIDPFTGGDKAAMAAAGIVAYGPFPWADGQRTEDVDRVLGEGRVLWIETEHFRIGYNMRSIPWPEDAAAKKALGDEIKLLHKKLPKIPEKPKRIEPWLRVHLAALRCEKAYGEFLQLIDASDADFAKAGEGSGPYLGLPDKFLVLLFQKKSDLARYLDRFCGQKSDTSMRFYHDKSRQMLFAMAADGLEGFDESGLHGHLVYALWQNLMSGYNGYSYPLPLWFSEGIAHWYGRKVESQFLNIQIRDDEAVADEKQNNWPVKVRRRAQYDTTWFPFATMAEWSKWEDLGFHAHTQSWSRIDYLMQVDRQRVGLMLKKLKSVPPGNSYEGMAGTLRTAAQKLLLELFDLDATTFDQKWREWVLKTYPKK
jgi:hypothetical protein